MGVTRPVQASPPEHEARPRPSLGLLVRMSISLVGAAGVTSALGFVFWWLAAQELPVEAVGLASAAVSAMLLLGNLAAMGLGTVLMREMPRLTGGRGSMILAALAVAGSVGVLAGTGFGLIAPYLSDELSMLSDSPAGLGIFALGVAATSVGLVLDQALIGLLRPHLQFWRNAVFAVAKLGVLAVLVAWLDDDRGLLVLLAWLGGSLVSFLPVAVIGGAWHAQHRAASGWALLRSLRGSALKHHALNVSRFTPYWVMPVVVTIIVSPAAAAAFYVALLIATLVYVMSGSLALSMFAVGSHDISAVPRQLRASLGLSSLAVVASFIGAVVLHGPVLGIFGPAYRDQASEPLLILVAAAAFVMVKDHWIAVMRVRREVGRAAALVGGFATVEIAVAAVVGATAGLTALTIGWTAVLSIEAAIMLPTVVRTIARGVAESSRR
jgi:O-antigen/teichoic acid export membrane protein